MNQEHFDVDKFLYPRTKVGRECKRLKMVGCWDDRWFNQTIACPLSIGIYILHKSKIKTTTQPITLRITGVLRSKREYVDIKIAGGLKAIKTIEYGECDDYTNPDLAELDKKVGAQQ